MIKAVLFDLDGTLLPMDQKTFVNAYLDTMTKALAPHGYDPELLARTIWKSIGIMARNEGHKTNEEVFWEFFCGVFGEKARQDEPVFDQYYHNEFQQVRHSCGYTPRAVQCVREIRDMGFRTVLATNPMFPAIATQSRVRWAGLEPEDFEFITTYEGWGHSKPNSAYFADILNKMGLTPQEAIMVGNDAHEDGCAKEVGMEVFLLTHDLINKFNRNITDWPQGDFDDLMTYVRRLNK